MIFRAYWNVRKYTFTKITRSLRTSKTERRTDMWWYIVPSLYCDICTRSEQWYCETWGAQYRSAKERVHISKYKFRNNFIIFPSILFQFIMSMKTEQSFCLSHRWRYKSVVKQPTSRITFWRWSGVVFLWQRLTWRSLQPMKKQQQQQNISPQYYLTACWYRPLATCMTQWNF